MDLTNRRFGRLVVVRREYVSKAKWEKIKQPTWMCECDCGKITYAFDSNLRQGRTQSCGCLRREVSKESSKRNFKHKPKEDLTGKRFGGLIVLRPSQRTLTNRIPLWVTQCECGTICEVRMDRLKSGKTKSCGCLRRTSKKGMQQ